MQEGSLPHEAIFYLLITMRNFTRVVRIIIIKISTIVNLRHIIIISIVLRTIFVDRRRILKALSLRP